MTKRGRKPKLVNPKTQSISANAVDFDLVYIMGYDVSEYFRMCVERDRETMRSPVEHLKKEIEELKDEVRDKTLELSHKEQRLKELEDEQAIKENEDRKKQEFVDHRKRIFEEKYLKIIYRTSGRCDIDFYTKVYRDFKFESLEEAKEWLLIQYKAIREGRKQYTEERVKVFLRWDERNLERLWPGPKPQLGICLN